MEPHLFSARPSQWVTWYNHVCNSPPRLPGLLLYAMSIVPEAILPQVHTEYTSVFQAVVFPGTQNSQKLCRRIPSYHTLLIFKGSLKAYKKQKAYDFHIKDLPFKPRGKSRDIFPS